MHFVHCALLARFSVHFRLRICADSTRAISCLRYLNYVSRALANTSLLISRVPCNVYKLLCSNLRRRCCGHVLVEDSRGRMILLKWRRCTSKGHELQKWSDVLPNYTSQTLRLWSHRKILWAIWRRVLLGKKSNVKKKIFSITAHYDLLTLDLLL